MAWRRLVAAAVAAGTAAAAAAQDGAALDPEAMTPAGREALRAEIRAYLLEHPEVLMEAISVLEERQAAEQASADAELVRANAGALFDDPTSWAGGNLDGDVTLVEFLDYRCGYCRRAHPELAELIESDGNIRFVVKEFPVLGDESVLAARFALGVREVGGDEAYAEAGDALMTLRGPVSTPRLAELAGTLGLDPDAVLAAMEGDSVRRAIDGNLALARQLGLRGTPSFVVEDRLLRGYLPLAEMREIVAELRAGG